MENQTTTTNKEAFKAKAKAAVDTVAHKVDELELKVQSAKGEAETKFKTQLAQLKERREELRKRYHSLEDAAEDKWDDAKEAFSKASDAFEKGFKELGKLFD